MIDRLDIKHFMTFEEISIPQLKRVNLIAGKNNSGKTALLEAIRIYVSEGDSSVVNHVLETRGGFFPGRTDSYQALMNRAVLEKQKNQPAISCFVSGGGDQLEIRGEKKARGNGRKFEEFKAYMRSSQSEDSDSGMNLLTPISAGFPNDNCIYTPFHSSISSLRDLWGKVVLTLKEDQVLEIIQKTIEPNLARIDVGADKVRIRLKNEFEPVPLQTLGDGVQRILLLALGLANAQNSYLLIDEIELGLHHSVMEKMWEIIFTYAEKWDIQVFATTHSQDAIKAFYYIASRKRNKDHAEFIRLQLGRTGKHEAIMYDGKRLEDSLELSLEIR